eukprot:g35210.t1
MWEIREKSSVPDNYICRKCDQLQLLTDHVVQLEKELDTLHLSGDCTSSNQICGTTTGSAVQQGGAKSRRAIVVVRDVSELMQDTLKQEVKETEVIVHTGTNDI